MRTEKEIYDLVLNFAFQDERIRIVTLEGSRTNVNIPKDNLQDYDITFFVIDMGEFLKSDDWLSVFGNRIMMQKPEDMELFPPEEKGFSYIMLFDDGVKIDLTLLPVSMLEEYLTRDKLVKIMLDKDNMIKTEIVPTDEDYYIKCPTERKFDDCCNEFWNVATYVSKGLLRGEILFAIDHMNEVLRHELLRMISWYVGTEKGFNFSLGKNYKFLDKHISKELWDNLLNTYSMSSYEEMWKSFDLCLCLFKKISKKVADSLGYNYPDYDENVTKYLETQKRISNKLSIAFTVKNPAKVSEELLESAAQNARAKAEILCRASGCEMGQLISIDYNWGELNIVSRTSYEMEDSLMPLAAMKKCCSPEIEPDDIDVSDTVAFTWEIK